MDDSPAIDLGPLEADFAILHTDLARIAEVPVGLGTAASAALTEILKSAKVADNESDGPLGRAFQTAVLAVMQESTSTDMHGNMSFNVDQQTLAVHGAPILRDVASAVQTGVQQLLDEFTTAVAAASPPSAKEAGPDAAPASPRPKLKLDLASLYGGLIKNVAEQAAKAPKKG